MVMLWINDTSLWYFFFFRVFNCWIKTVICAINISLLVSLTAGTWRLDILVVLELVSGLPVFDCKYRVTKCFGMFVLTVVFSSYEPYPTRKLGTMSAQKHVYFLQRFLWLILGCLPPYCSESKNRGLSSHLKRQNVLQSKSVGCYSV